MNVARVNICSEFVYMIAKFHLANYQDQELFEVASEANLFAFTVLRVSTSNLSGDSDVYAYYILYIHRTHTHTHTHIYIYMYIYI